MKLSKYFDREEFCCRCGFCGFDTVDAKLLEILEAVRRYFDSPVIIKSACRCKEHNKLVGGMEKSEHLQGRAADIVVKGHEPQEVFNYIDDVYGEYVGLHAYDTFTHIDSRGHKARW